MQFNQNSSLVKVLYLPKEHLQYEYDVEERVDVNRSVEEIENGETCPHPVVNIITPLQLFSDWVANVNHFVCVEHLSIVVHFFDKSDLAVAYLELEQESRNLIYYQEYYESEKNLNDCRKLAIIALYLLLDV